MFNARNWLNERVIEARDVTPSAWEAVSDFSILWQLFEQRLCATNANIKKLDELAESLDYQAFPPDLAACFDYWRRRYVDGSDLHRNFDDLFPNSPQWRKWQKRTVDVLLANAPNDIDKAKAVLTILYRLRNNLFHGTKEMSTFVQQEENLRQAAVALAAIMSWKGIY